MFGSPKKGKHYPPTVAYLEKATARSKTPDALAVGMFAALLIGGVLGLAVGAAFGPLGAVLGLPFGIFAGAVLGSAILPRIFHRRKPDPLEERATKAILDLKKLHESRKLRTWMDPVALELLEAGAFHYARVTAALDGPYWSTRDLQAHWVSVRNQARQASETAMYELVLMCQACVGKPQTERKDEFKQVVEDLVDLDIADALQGLKEFTNPDWSKFRHQSPMSKQIFEPARALAERLKILGDEVETRMTELTGLGPEGLPSGAVGSLDVVLSELRAVRQAEAEIADEQQELRN